MTYNERQKHKMNALNALFSSMVNHFDLVTQLTSKNIFERYYSETEIFSINQIMYMFFMEATEPLVKGVTVPYKHFLFILENIDLCGNDLYDCMRARISVGKKASHCRDAYRVYETEYMSHLYKIDGKELKKTAEKRKPKLKLVCETLDQMESEGKSEHSRRAFLDSIEEEVIKSYGQLDEYIEAEEYNITHKKPVFTIIKGGLDE